jgi:hypothetical protein
MKKQAVYILAALTLITTAGISQAYGQHPSAGKFAIPFDFSIRGKTFPAGIYTVGRSSLPYSGALLIRSWAGNRGSWFPVIQIESLVPREQSQLVFTRYGDTYCLRKVWSAGQDIGGYVVKTHAEQMLERKLEATAAKTEEMVVVARRQ